MEFIIFAIIPFAVFLIAHFYKGNGARPMISHVEPRAEQMRQLKDEAERSRGLRNGPKPVDESEMEAARKMLAEEFALADASIEERIR